MRLWSRRASHYPAHLGAGPHKGPLLVLLQRLRLAGERSFIDDEAVPGDEDAIRHHLRSNVNHDFQAQSMLRASSGRSMETR